MTKTMDAMGLHNVHGAKDYGDDTEITSFAVHPTIAEVIWELASKNPLWQFHATNGVRMYERTNVAYTSFKVMLNNKVLGTISRIHTRRGVPAIVVSCKRIADKLERKDGYETTDPKKAIARVRKEFAPKTTKELINEATERATEVARKVYQETETKMRKASGVVHGGALDFFVNGPGLEIYKSYLYADRAEDAVILNAMNRIVELKDEMVTVASVRNKMGSVGTALVVLDEGKYLVKILDELQMYNDTTLPQEFRGKLGLLKLVQPNQFVSSAGFRVSEEVFIIDLAQA